MELLEFARGPVLLFAITVFIGGISFRIFSLLLMWRTKDSSAGRAQERPAFIAAIREIIRRLWPQAVYKERTMFALVNGYVFHFGLALIVFFLAPHILFIKDLIGLSWPSLPNNVIYAISIVTMVSLIAALVMRFSNPAQLIISTFDDWFSWIVTFVPVLTGVIATSHLGARYETLLALHILSVAVLLVWLPFGKLMHGLLVFVTRSQTGAQLNHRGAQL
jgi:nitrate reductase gamma subunit